MKQHSKITIALITFLTICSTLPVDLHAQENSQPFHLGFWAGSTQYNGDLGQGFYRSSGSGLKPHAGISAAWQLNERFDFTSTFTAGSIGYAVDRGKSFKANLFQLNWQVRGFLFQNDIGRFNLYGLAGVGVAYFGNTKKPGADMFFPFGAGVRVKVNEKLYAFAQENFAYTDHDSRDLEAKENNDAFLLHSIGLAWRMSGPQDEDKDGVSDKKDACKGTLPGLRVDESGCPIDRDGDGIVDKDDACPDIKGVASAKGCPDQDGDGITDADDRCPQVKGITTLKGCPDTDGDGLTDTEDLCPDEAGGSALKGCPDRDKDNVADRDDKCPDEAGIAANKGCPEVKEEVKQLFTEALQGIEFETGKDIIRPSSFGILDNVVKVMIEHPEYLLEINGHTDNTGDSASNLQLSQKRADAVKNYLIRKGVASARMTAKGFGDSSPVADNKTQAGKAKNRRVEFKINF